MPLSSLAVQGRVSGHRKGFLTQGTVGEVSRVFRGFGESPAIQFCTALRVVTLSGPTETVRPKRVCFRGPSAALEPHFTR